MENLRSLWVALNADTAADAHTFLDVVRLKLADTPSEGIANPGVSFSARRCYELEFLIKAVVAVKKLETSAREALLSDAWKTGRVFDKTAGAHNPQMTHMLRHLLFPQSFEPIFSRRSKRRITESFSGIPRKETKRWSITQLDEELLLAREQLQVLYETKDLSLYREPLLSTWQADDSGSDAPSSERRYWVEICDVVNRPDRQHGRHALGEALWSPRRSSGAGGAGAVMRELEDGDVIFHFTDNEGITGASLVSGEMDENFTCPEDSDWKNEPGYRVALQEFVEVVPVLRSSAFLAESRFQDDLRRFAEKHQSLFFNRQLTLNQGTYLSQAPESLVRIFDEAYFVNSKAHLPHLEFADPEDHPEPHQHPRQTNRQQPANQVLYGPSGTGKTYTAMVRAVEICDGHATTNHDDLLRRFRTLQSENRIRLITFHPAYGYADFIESTCPAASKSPPEDNEAELEQIKPGVFKEIAERARLSEISRNSPVVPSADQPVWKLALGSNVGAAFRDMINDGFITLHHPGELNFRAGASPEAILQQLQQDNPQMQADDEAVAALHGLTNEMQTGDLVILSDSELSYRAIGRVSGDYMQLHKANHRACSQVRGIEWFTS